MNEFELCPRFEKAISILSQRWTALILYQLMTGPQRFCTMTDKLGVSGKTLSERLKDLEQQDLSSVMFTRKHQCELSIH